MLLLLALGYSNFALHLIIGVAIAVLYIWLGVISFLGKTPHKAKYDPENGASGIALWMALTYFSSIPAGIIVTVASLFKFYSNDPKVINQVRRVMCIIGAVIGFAVYLYACANYSHCDEVLYTSIIGLLTKLIKGDL